VSPLKIKIPSKNMHEKPTNTPIIHSVYWLCMVAPTCFGITLPSSGSIPSAFWEMLNWGAVGRILWLGMLCLVTWCVAISDFRYIYIYIYIYIHTVYINIYIYDVKFLALLGAPYIYIYDISRLRVKFLYMKKDLYSYKWDPITLMNSILYTLALMLL
jgi:hypothetical protein